jgi:phage tail-like protein
MATPRPNPYSNFNFIVEADGIGPLGAFSEVTGLDSENTPIEYREGADPTNGPRKQPGVEKYSNVQLKRGVTGTLALWNWRKQVRDGSSTAPPSATVRVKLLNENHEEGSPAMTWVLYGAWPMKITGPTLNAKGNDIAIEQVDLVVERLDIE